MASYKAPKPSRKDFRVDAPDFRDLVDIVCQRGTHLMKQELNWIKELAIMTAAKSFNSEWLRDNQENFLTKFSTLRYVNGYNDVDDLDFAEMQELWHRSVLDIIDDLNDVDIFDYDNHLYVMEINVIKFTDRYIDLERILHKRAESPYD